MAEHQQPCSNQFSGQQTPTGFDIQSLYSYPTAHGPSAMSVFYHPHLGHSQFFNHSMASPYLISPPGLQPPHALPIDFRSLVSETNSTTQPRINTVLNPAASFQPPPPAIGYVIQRRSPLIFITLPNSELQSYSRQFVMKFGLHDSSFTIPTNGINDAAILDVKAVVPPNLTTPNKSKLKESNADTDARYWLLICKADDDPNQPDIMRINNFSMLVNSFRERMGKVILNELQLKFAKELESLRKVSNYDPAGADEFTTFQSVTDEVRSSKDKNGILFSMLQESFDNSYGPNEDRNELADHIMNIFKFRYSHNPNEKVSSKGFVVQFVSQKRSDMKGVLNDILDKKPTKRKIVCTRQGELRKQRKQDLRSLQKDSTPFITTWTIPPSNSMLMPAPAQWMNCPVSMPAAAAAAAAQYPPLHIQAVHSEDPSSPQQSTTAVANTSQNGGSSSLESTTSHPNEVIIQRHFTCSTKSSVVSSLADVSTVSTEPACPVIEESSTTSTTFTSPTQNLLEKNDLIVTNMTNRSSPIICDEAILEDCSDSDDCCLLEDCSNSDDDCCLLVPTTEENISHQSNNNVALLATEAPSSKNINKVINEVTHTTPSENFTTPTTNDSNTSLAMKTADDVGCELEHRLEDLIFEDNAAYWGSGFFLEDVTCSECMYKFRNKQPLQSNQEKNPVKVHFCQNLMESHGSICKFALCDECWNCKLLDRASKESPRRNKRKRFPKKIASL